MLREIIAPIKVKQNNKGKKLKHPCILIRDNYYAHGCCDIDKVK